MFCFHWVSSNFIVSYTFVSHLTLSVALNIMCVQYRLVLIDLDASVRYGVADSYGGMKYSSGYIAPEMIYTDTDVGDIVCVRSPSDSLYCKLTSPPSNSMRPPIDIPLFLQQQVRICGHWAC
jgi:hypothetical protein